MFSIKVSHSSPSGLETMQVNNTFFIHILGLRAMVNTLLRSLKLLSDVLVLFLFFLAVMALIGLQLFVGELRNKCVRDMPVNLTVDFNDYLQNESKQRNVRFTQWLFYAGRIVLLSFHIPYNEEIILKTKPENLNDY